MGCACNKRQRAGSGPAPTPGTYRVYVNGRKVYETTNRQAADKVAERFTGASILPPGQDA